MYIYIYIYIYIYLYHILLIIIHGENVSLFHIFTFIPEKTFMVTSFYVIFKHVITKIHQKVFAVASNP